MTWALLIWTVAMFAWAVGGGTSSVQNSNSYCQSHVDAYFSKQDCLTATHAGTAIGVVLIILLWFMGFVVLSLVWFMTRPKRRDCPACGESVKRGLTVCKSCGYDFKAAHQPTPQVGPPPVAHA
jgi:hypothetical protein